MRGEIVFALAAVAACGGPAQEGARAGDEVTCPDGPRKARDCTSEVQYSGSKTQGELSVMSLGSGAAKHEQVALRRVDQETERFIASQNQLCRDYNSCALAVDDYNREAKAVRDRLGKIPQLAELVKNAKTGSERTRAIDALYRETVPDDRRLEEVTFRMGLEAKLPDALGGAELRLAPMMALPTGARAWFTVGVSADAHVYLFQKAPGGGVTVLFPDERIGTKNPLSAGTAARIPHAPGMSFRLNDKDLGLETVYVAVSRKPIARLDQALSRVNAGQVSRIGDDQLLASFGAVAPAGAPPPKNCSARAFELEGAPQQGCAASRGFELDTGESSAAGAATFAVRTEPGDDLIVKAFCFEHITEKQYAERSRGGQQPVRARSTVLEE